MVENPADNAGDSGDTSLIPGSGRSPGGENGNPLQYSCLEDPMDRGAWWAAIHRLIKRWTRLSTRIAPVCIARHSSENAVFPLILLTARLWSHGCRSSLLSFSTTLLFNLMSRDRKLTGVNCHTDSVRVWICASGWLTFVCCLL